MDTVANDCAAVYELEVEAGKCMLSPEVYNDCL